MDYIRQIFNQTGGLHHAYLIVGERQNTYDSLTKFLENEVSFSIQNNPDFFHGIYDVLGIDEARSLKNIAAMRAIGRMKVVILATSTMTNEAQNSLLKILEDPTGSTRFFIIMPNAGSLLPTLVSRLFVVPNENPVNIPSQLTGYSGMTKKFLKSAPSARISLLSEIIENKDKNEAINFLNSLEMFIAKDIGTKNSSKEVIDASEEIIKNREYLYGRSPSVKMILEHISAIMPILADKQ